MDASCPGDRPTYAFGRCPICGGSITPGEPGGHWDGKGGIAGPVYVVSCAGCDTRLLGFGDAYSDLSELVGWQKYPH
jgi:hypothetical protein